MRDAYHGWGKMTVPTANSEASKGELTRYDSVRLEALEKYEILGTEPDPAIDDLVELAARACNTPIAGVSFVTKDRISADDNAADVFDDKTTANHCLARQLRAKQHFRKKLQYLVAK